MKTDCILLVEDSPDDIALTLRAFRKSQVANEVVVTEDGEAALDYLFGTGKYEGRDTKDVPTVVLLDLKLPKIDGFEVLNRIRSDERTKLLPVIILTSSKEEEDVAKGYRMGANSYIRKPVDFDAFVDAVIRLQLYWLLVNEPPPEYRKRDC